VDSARDGGDSGRFGGWRNERWGQMWSPFQVLDEGVNNFAGRMDMATKRIRFNSGNQTHNDHCGLPSPTTDTGQGYPPKTRAGSSGRTP
jgi:hypothetical protein